MNTVDGNKDSAQNIKKALYHQMKKEYKHQNNKKANQYAKENMKSEINHRIMTKTMLRFTILRIRAKISYHAYMNRNTIMEHFMKQTTKSNRIFNGHSQLLRENEKLIEEFLDSIKTTSLKGVFENIIKINNALRP